MVYPSVGVESDFIQGLGNELLFAPVNVPVILFGLFVLAILQSLLNEVDEKSFELDFRAKIKA